MVAMFLMGAAANRGLVLPVRPLEKEVVVRLHLEAEVAPTFTHHGLGQIHGTAGVT